MDGPWSRSARNVTRSPAASAATSAAVSLIHTDDGAHWPVHCVEQVARRLRRPPRDDRALPRSSSSASSSLHGASCGGLLARPGKATAPARSSAAWRLSDDLRGRRPRAWKVWGPAQRRPQAQARPRPPLPGRPLQARAGHRPASGVVRSLAPRESSAAQARGGPALLSRAAAEGGPWIAATVVRGPAVLLGAGQRAGRVVRLTACAVAGTPGAPPGHARPPTWAIGPSSGRSPSRTSPPWSRTRPRGRCSTATYAASSEG